MRAVGLDVGLDIGMYPGAQPPGPVIRRAAVKRRFDRCQKLPGIALAKRIEHVVLGREVMIEGALGNLCRLDNLIDRGRFHALCQEQAFGRRHQLVEPHFRWLGARTQRGPGRHVCRRCFHFHHGISQIRLSRTVYWKAKPQSSNIHMQHQS
ncbi:hypothetical protein D3C72_1962330 [compost metagenome]